MTQEGQSNGESQGQSAVIPPEVIESYREIVKATSWTDIENRSGEDDLSPQQRLEHLESGDVLGQIAYQFMFLKRKLHLIQKESIGNPSDEEVVRSIVEMNQRVAARMEEYKHLG